VLDPRFALNICLASTATVWILMVLGALVGAPPSGLAYALLTLNLISTATVYQRYRGIFW
jgi:hypothetical protein